MSDVTNHAAPTQAAVFTEEECREFEQSDIHGTKIIVGLMSAIFFIGLLMYTVIAYITSS